MVLRVAILGASLVLAACGKSEGGDNLLLSAATGSGGSSSAGPGGSGSSFSADLARELGGGSAAASDPKRPAGNGGSASDPKRAGASANHGSDPAGAAVVAKPASGSRTRAPGPVKVPADLAAIKLSLLPNWDRDLGEAGTFQYVVRIKGTQSTKTFSFRYGYDDARAPADRDQYKKFLQDSKTMVGEIKDRQRGSAWFLEGNDGSGPAFRYVVLYGGKRLVCYGSMYKDADSNRLGDDRDQTVIQAKQICETLAL